jgi:hypothetical protein
MGPGRKKDRELLVGRPVVFSRALVVSFGFMAAITSGFRVRGSGVAMAVARIGFLAFVVPGF